MIVENGANTFQPVSEPEKLLDVVKLRLPRCANVFNVIQLFNLFRETTRFYSWGPENDESKCWILGKIPRDANRIVFVVSNPNNLTQISSDVVEAFENLPSEIINWDCNWDFNGLEHSVSQLVVNISLKHGNVTQIAPMELFCFSREEVANKPLSPIIDPSNPVQLKSLNSDAGFKFWKEILRVLYLPGTPPEAKREHIEKCESIGAYITDDLVVSNAALSPTGHIGLATFEAHKRKGYAGVCYQTLVNKLVQETLFIPCSYVDVKNKESIGLHVKAIQGYTVPRPFIVYFVKRL